MSTFDQRYHIFFTYGIILRLQFSMRKRRSWVYSALQTCCHHFFYVSGSWWYIFEHNYPCLCVAHISPFQCTKRPSGKVDCALSLKFLLSASHLWNLEDVQQQISFQCLEKSDRWAGLFPSDCCSVSAFSVHWNNSNIPLCLQVYPQLHSLVQMCCYDVLVF